MISSDNIQHELKCFEKQLMSKRARKKILLTLEWKKTFPDEAGVYVVFEKDTVVYVGEAKCLSNRLNDMRFTRNHAMRRNIGRHHYSNRDDFEDATTKKPFPDNIEKLLIKRMKGMELSTIFVAFGRKEIEEWIIDQHRPIYNKLGKKSSR